MLCHQHPAQCVSNCFQLDGIWWKRTSCSCSPDKPSSSCWGWLLCFDQGTFIWFWRNVKSRCLDEIHTSCRSESSYLRLVLLDNLAMSKLDPSWPGWIVHLGQLHFAKENEIWSWKSCGNGNQREKKCKLRIVRKSEGPHWPCRKLIYMESPPPLMEVCGLKPELL